MRLVLIIGFIGSSLAGQPQDSIMSTNDEDVLLQMRRIDEVINVNLEDHELAEQQKVTKFRQGLLERASNPDTVNDALASLGLSDHSLESLGLSNYSTAMMQLSVDLESDPGKWDGNYSTALMQWGTKADWSGGTNLNTAMQETKNQDKFYKAGAPVFTQLGNIFGKWVTGQGVTKGDWLTLGETAATAAVNMIFLTLGLAFPLIGGLMTLLGAFVGGLIKALFALAADKPPSTGELINSALAKERLASNKDFWNGISEELSSLSGLFVDGSDTDAQTAWYLVVQHDLAVNRDQVFGDCMEPSTWTSDACYKTLQDGMLPVMVEYAESHVTIMWEILNLFMENPAVDIAIRRDQVDILHARILEVGTEYHAALQNAWEYYYPWRMRAIWNPFMIDVTQNYSWWDDSWTYEVTKNDIHHPFDFLYAFKDQGYGDLDIEFPLDRSVSTPTYNKDKDNVRNWAYAGCIGERHSNASKDGYTVNDACNLYQHIVGNESGQCGCAGKDTGDWVDANVGKNSPDGCWSQCMSDYIAGVDAEMNDGFGQRIKDFEQVVRNVTFPGNWRGVLGANGGHCSDESMTNISHCTEVFDYIEVAYSGTTTASDSTLPAGCSLRLSDNKIVMNDASNEGQGADGYEPGCGAMFFATSSDTLVRTGKLVAGDKLTSEDGLKKLNMQNDGNLVVYDENTTSHWGAGTLTADSYAQLESNGNLVIYAADQTNLWSTDSEGATKLVLHNNCTLQLLGIHGEALWSNEDDPSYSAC